MFDEIPRDFIEPRFGRDDVVVPLEGLFEALCNIDVLNVPLLLQLLSVSRQYARSSR